MPKGRAKGIPLPTVDSVNVQLIIKEDPNFIGAYTICLKYETKLAADEDKLRYVRIIGYLLLHAPNQDVRSEVANCIRSRKDSKDLTDIGEFFERNVIVHFKKYKGRTPKLPSSKSCESEKDEVKADILEAPKNYQDAKHRALIRDNWRCVITGIFEDAAPEHIKGDSDAVCTQCAYIIPESTFYNVEPKSENKPKPDYVASILAVLKQFRSDIDEFNGPKVHSLINVMSMELNVHDKFDRLNLYLKATSGEHRYEVKWFGSKPPNLRQFVTFSTSDSKNLPVPAPELLALHATCCKVAHLSGAAEYIDGIYRDADEIGVLSTDGTSWDVLDYLFPSLLEPIRPLKPLPELELEPVTVHEPASVTI